MLLSLKFLHFSWVFSDGKNLNEIILFVCIRDYMRWLQELCAKGHVVWVVSHQIPWYFWGGLPGLCQITSPRYSWCVHPNDPPGYSNRHPQFLASSYALLALQLWARRTKREDIQGRERRNGLRSKKKKNQEWTSIGWSSTSWWFSKFFSKGTCQNVNATSSW